MVVVVLDCQSVSLYDMHDNKGEKKRKASSVPQKGKDVRVKVTTLCRMKHSKKSLRGCFPYWKMRDPPSSSSTRTCD